MVLWSPPIAAKTMQGKRGGGGGCSGVCGFGGTLGQAHAAAPGPGRIGPPLPAAFPQVLLGPNMYHMFSDMGTWLDQLPHPRSACSALCRLLSPLPGCWVCGGLLLQLLVDCSWAQNPNRVFLAGRGQGKQRLGGAPCAVRKVGCFPPPVATGPRVLNSAPHSPCWYTRDFSFWSSACHGSQGPKFCTPDAVLN